MALKKTKSPPLIRKNLLLPFLLIIGFLLALGYHKEKERLRPKLDIFWCSSFLSRQDQVKDWDCNKSSITRPRTSIKHKVCVRIWIWFSIVIPSMDSINPLSLFIFYICYIFFKQSLIFTRFFYYLISQFLPFFIIFHSIILTSPFHQSILNIYIIISHII